jgi:hypothetical protein
MTPCAWSGCNGNTRLVREPAMNTELSGDLGQIEVIKADARALMTGV